MLLIHCPWRGPRPEPEFVHGGELRPTPHTDLGDEERGGHPGHRSNPHSPHARRWWHAHGCGSLFNAVRDTHGGRFPAICPLDEPPVQESL